MIAVDNLGMRTAALVLWAACSPAAPPATPPRATPAPPATPPPDPAPPVAAPVVASPAPPVAARRCLPVVSRECGCVYTCGVGVDDGDHWRVTHAFWSGIELQGRVEPWCVAGRCTDAFAVQLPCSVICAPRPADATCHFDAGGACVGGET